MTRRAAWCAIVVTAVLAVALRVAALDSDPYPRLSWSTGLLTDEGYYIHNARNLVLFGVERTDDFNNMLIMPTLHAVQVAVFRVWGAGVVPARWISVLCSLVGIVFLFSASRRAFGVQVAAYATLFNGLDHANLLYNRMALMDTPAEMLLILAFYAWVCGSEETVGAAKSRAWMAVCGAVLALAFATRGLAGIVIPAAIAAAYFAGRTINRLQSGADSSPSAGRGYSKFMALCGGLATGLALYAALWYLPHREEISRVNHYYLLRQILPNSLPRLLLNAANAWLGDERGAAPFLMRHTPALMLLAGAWLVLARRRGRVDVSGQNTTEGREIGPIRPTGQASQTSPSHPTSSTNPNMAFVLWWLALGALFLSITSYSPSRYYLLFYPPLAIVAACALANLREVARAALQSRAAMIALGGYVAYHGALAFLHHATPAAISEVACATAAGAIAGLMVQRSARTPNMRVVLDLATHGDAASPAAEDRASGAPAGPVAIGECDMPPRLAEGRPLTATAVTSEPALRRHLIRLAGPVALLLWVMVNAGYYIDWAAHLEYNQRDASRWIAANLPADTVLIGDVAPGVSLYNSNPAISVIPGLCNDRKPVERRRGKPRAIVILDGAIKERWWTTQYPVLVSEPNRTKLFPKIGRFPVGVYRVTDRDGLMR